jgi:hydrogenase expression/formation protein HypC
MCLAAPGKVIKIEGRKATVQYHDDIRYALIGEERVKIGDYVLVQMGIIIQILFEKDAAASEEAWTEK